MLIFFTSVGKQVSVFSIRNSIATGSQKTVSLAGLGILTFPLPPLAEQHRIVAKVDELMALCDQLEAAKTEREQSRDRVSGGQSAPLELAR